MNRYNIIFGYWSNPIENGYTPIQTDLRSVD